MPLLILLNKLNADNYTLIEVTKRRIHCRFQISNSWQMEDHLCPRLVQPQAACLSCLSRPQAQADQCTRCINPTRTISTDSVLRLSHLLQAPTKTVYRTNYAVQPVSRNAPRIQQVVQHAPQTHDLDSFSGSTIELSTAISTAIPALLPHTCQTRPLYARWMKRYTAMAARVGPVTSGKKEKFWTER